MDLFGIMGFIVGGLALAQAIYRFISHDVQVDADLKAIKELLKTNNLSEMSTQLKALWEVYGLDVLRSRPDLAQHRSPWRLTEAGEQLIPAELKKKIESLEVPEGWPDNVASEWLIIKAFGLDALCDYASSVHLKLPEAIAILSTHLECAHRNCQKAPAVETSL
jgi:hypothetical protein